MTVLSIQNITIDNDNVVTVEAVVEDMRLLHCATHLDPEEYASALCTATFELDEGEQLPTDETDLCVYLGSLYLNWQLVDTTDWDLDS